MSLKLKSTEGKPGYFVIHLEGRLDTITTPQLEQMLQYLITAAPRSITFEMTKLDYITSAGLRAILTAYKKLKSTGGICGVLNVPPQIRKILDIADISPSLNIFASEAEADAYFDAVQSGRIGKKS
ncbi:MAG: STAS domain-containing protein [bacterium]